MAALCGELREGFADSYHTLFCRRHATTADPPDQRPRNRALCRGNTRLVWSRCHHQGAFGHAVRALDGDLGDSLWRMLAASLHPASSPMSGVRATVQPARLSELGRPPLQQDVSALVVRSLSAWGAEAIARPWAGPAVGYDDGWMIGRRSVICEHPTRAAECPRPAGSPRGGANRLPRRRCADRGWGTGRRSGPGRSRPGPCNCRR